MSTVLDTISGMTQKSADSPPRTTGNVPPMKTNQNAKMDAWFRGTTRFFAFIVLSLLVAIMVSLAVGSQETLEKYGLSFLWSAEWDPVNNEYGALIPIVGTLVTSIIALIIAIPVSFGIALFLTELAPAWLRRPLGIAVEMLAAIPSIIYGMWGLFIFAPVFKEYVQPLMIATLGNIPGVGILFQGPAFGIGVFTAGIILAVMIIPFISSVMRDVFELVPAMLKESAYGLGATTWEVMWKVVLPFTKVGVIGGIMLGLGRALGETMAVTFVIGNAYRLSGSLFQPGNSIASSLANEFAEAVDDTHLSALIELGLILFLITTIVLACSKLLLQRLSKGEGART